MKILKVEELNEYMNNNSMLDEQELLEMANISSRKTGIKDIVIWAGPNPKYHGYRIKVSNIANKISSDNCFTITIPDFKVMGDVNTNLITKEVFNDIIKFIKLNIDLIKKYSDYDIYTEDFLDNIKPVK